MTNSERAAAAAELKATGQCNCTQAVLKVFEDRLPVDSDTLMKLTAGYAAGMGCMESTCGALIGAVMVAGILTNGKGSPDRCATTMIMYLNNHMYSKNYGMAGAVSTVLFLVCAVLCIAVLKTLDRSQEGGAGK